MNKMYAVRNGKPLDNARQNTAEIRTVNKLIEGEKAERERSSQVADYYTNGKQKDVR